MNPHAENLHGEIVATKLIVGMEVHVELATRTKMFTRCPSPAHPDFDAAAPNALIDPVVLGLPGALPVMNRAAVEMAMMVGLALNCSIASFSKWDRKGYFYADLPKGYQISQYDLPICFDGVLDLPAIDADGEPDWLKSGRRIGIIRAHLEEDAGKLLHEMPAAIGVGGGGGASGGQRIDFSIADFNRAGTPLLEIVTQPDFTSADETVVFAKMLRNMCRFLGVTQGVMQKGHMRFEPNINMELSLADGGLVRTPIVEVKNLNSFKSLKGAIEHEAREQPRRWLEDRREMGRGAKSTRGWDDVRNMTFTQREKEDAHDYRYFPDPDLPPVVVSDEWRERVRTRVPRPPHVRLREYVREFDLGKKEAAALTEERAVCELFEAATRAAELLSVPAPRAGKVAANIMLQSGSKRANERSGAETAAVLISDLGVTAAEIGAIVKLREDGKLNNQSVDELFGLLCERGGAATSSAVPQTPLTAADVRAVFDHVTALAQGRGLLIVQDDSAMDAWIAQAIAENAQSAADVRAGKDAAIGRLVGAVMKLAAGRADAKTARERLLKALKP
jgi:aspartyl-tRNA(Asn)/glutamyl-tRNA(Gln) amidotransferase subunit B